MKVAIVRGNIVEAPTEVIVNAANTDLVLGAGVAGAIRRAAGPRVQKECDALAPIPVGEVAVTSAGDLPQRFIFHAATMSFAAPSTTADIVRQCTRRALEEADRLGCKSIAFPALGTGVAGLDMESCAEAMLGAVCEYRARRGSSSSLEKILFVLFDEQAERIFRQKWAELAPTTA